MNLGTLLVAVRAADAWALLEIVFLGVDVTCAFEESAHLVSFACEYYPEDTFRPTTHPVGDRVCLLRTLADARAYVLQEWSPRHDYSFVADAVAMIMILVGDQVSV
jgi:hypothetical protein